MKLRNYTSSVPVERSLSAIETLLVMAGATHIARFYDDQKRIAGFLFQIPINGLSLAFKLPVNSLAVKRILETEIKHPRRGTMNKVGEQAERTAWKLLHEWVHIQLSMIEMQQAEAMQVFLPYAYDGKTEQTYFEKLKEGGFKQLTSGRGE
jgi:hypothetical protein